MVTHPKDPSRKPAAGQGAPPLAAPAQFRGERVAKALARAGVSSRREAERMIEEGRVALNGRVLTSPAINVAKADILTVDGKVIADKAPVRLWRYHKPTGLMTTHKDPKGRPTVFDRLPKELGRVISIGRLDLNSEGLLLLTNDGDLARSLELPSTGLVRRYRARAFGRVGQEKLDTLKDGLVVDGVAYGAIEAELERGSGSNVWIGVALSEGKNREVRKVLDALGMKVNRLIRVSYGPIELGDLEPGAVEEVSARQVQRMLQGDLVTPDRAAPSASRPATARPQRGRKPDSAQRRGAASSPRSAATTTPTGRTQTKTWAKPERPKSSQAEAKPKTAYKSGWARPKARAPVKVGAKSKGARSRRPANRPE